MARFRKEKGGSSTKPTAVKDSKKSSSTKSRKPRAEDGVLKEQVLALGGTQDDYDLVKDIKDTSISGPSPEDPTLSKDVSKFLKGLNIGESQPQVDEDEDIIKDSPKTAKKTKKTRALKAEPNDGKKPQPTRAPKPEPTPEAPGPPLPTMISLNSTSHFVVQPIAQWYTSIPRIGPVPASSSTITPAQLASLTSRASTLHIADINIFQKSSSSNSSSSEANFLSKIIQSGTLSDRLSALTLLVQSSPLHNTKALENLKGMAERGKGKGGRDESLKALRCVVDWWVGGGAPDRKLKYFRDQPLEHPSVTDQHLLLWYFEDWLKKYFFSILQILESLSLDPLPYVRTQALTLIFTLLRDKPEQEQNLLRLLVNKLGDNDKSLCSRASYHLLQLLQSHPSMKSVIVREIIALVLRPPTPPTTTAASLPTGTGKHIRFTDNDPKPKTKPKHIPTPEKKTGNAHARYYATITFNQIVLTPGDREVALQLINVYFEMFKELLGEGNDDDEVEDGDGDKEGGEEAEDGNELKKDKGGRIRDGGKGKGKGTGKGKGKGRVTEVKGAAGFAEVEDAHSKLISAILTGVNRALPFAKIDSGDVGLNKHIDTLFLITHTSTFNISLQALVLIQQMSASLTSSPSASSSTTPSTSKSITDRYYRTLYASLHDSRLATSSKQAMYLNLLFKSIKADAGNVDGERVKALVRRFVQLLVSGGSGATEFVAGGLYLLGELFSTIPGLRSMLDAPGNSESEDYDPKKRDPQYAHASSSPLWELIPLLHHYHPTVSLHARQLLSSQPLTASADLSLNTLSHFLDRFVYKNPKKLKTDANANVSGKGKGSSAMQPAASGLDGIGVKLMKGEAEDADGLVNEGAFLRRRVEDVPADQVFFHKFFTRKNVLEKAKAAKAKKRKDHGESDSGSGSGSDEEDEDEDEAGDEEVEEGQKDEDEDEEGSDDEEAEVWKAMKATMPKAVGEDDDLMEESDELPSDFDVDDSVGGSGDEGGSESDEEEIDPDDDALSLVEASDNEDLISLDGDLPGGLIEYDGSDASEGEEGEWGGIGDGDGSGGKKRKREETKGERRKKLRSLPTFASYEDYAKMIEDGPEDDL